MTIKKQLIDLIDILKNIFRYSMFNYKGSITLDELEYYKTLFFEKLNSIFSRFEILEDNIEFKKYNFLIQLKEKFYFLMENKKFYELALLANETYHKIYEILGVCCKEEEFVIFSKDKSKEISNVNCDFVLILDNIRSPFNVGSFFRLGDAVNLKKIFLSGISPTPDSKKVLRASMGTTKNIDWELVKFAENKVEQLKNEGYKIISVETTSKSIDYKNMNYKILKKVCFVFGNEEFGINNSILKLSDFVVQLPMYGRKNSLNVSMAAGIILYNYLSEAAF